MDATHAVGQGRRKEVISPIGLVTKTFFLLRKPKSRALDPEEPFP